ncbi:MAG TPA: hypothetical protein VJM11_03045 [Nevskiaceae bacterium]|nr:hypothetical protein [Nevskiaceae bacterium]
MRNMVRRPGLARAAGAALLVLPLLASAAGERELVVTVVVEGAKSWRDGQDWDKTTISERYEVKTRVRALGDLTSTNTLDPAFAKQQLATAAAVQRRVEKAQGAPGVAVPKTPQEQQAFAAQMQKEQAACGRDTACLMKLSQKYAPVLTAMSLQASTGAVSGAEVDAAEAALDTEAPAIFQNYGGYDGCPTTARFTVDDRSEGAYEDVGGSVPYTIRRVADDPGNPTALKLLCLSATSVYDTRSKELWLQTLPWFGPRGSYIHTERGRTDKTEEDVPVEKAAFEWAASVLKRAKESGTASKVLPLAISDPSNAKARGTFEGQVRVTLTWAFRPV